jgi:phosphoglycolate phosphatase
MNIKHIVWDWNGTLLNDKQLAITAINVLLKKHDLPTITLEQYLKIFSFPVIDYYKRLGFDFDKTPFTIVGTEFIEEYTARMYDVNMHDGAKDVLKYFFNNGITQSLLSAAKQQMLDRLMEYHDIDKYFIKVSGLSDHYANSKLEAGKAWINELNHAPSEILFIGDTLHDAEVAREIGANCMLIAAGHATYKKLESSGKKVFRNIIEFKEWFEKQ